MRRSRLPKGQDRGEHRVSVQLDTLADSSDTSGQEQQVKFRGLTLTEGIWVKGGISKALEVLLDRPPSLLSACFSMNKLKVTILACKQDVLPYQ